jgi:hypothetical protein
MNPINMVKNMFGKGTNPKQILEQLVMGNSNPMMNNLMQMAQNGNGQSLENFARNICKERGLNFETEFAKFMSQIKG